MKQASQRDAASAALAKRDYWLAVGEALGLGLRLYWWSDLSSRATFIRRNGTYLDLPGDVGDAILCLAAGDRVLGPEG